MPAAPLRFPAEWEPQSGILLAWPHGGTDWAERLADVEETYIALVAAITRFERAVVCVADDDIEAYARARLSSARVPMERVVFVQVDYDASPRAVLDVLNDIVIRTAPKRILMTFFFGLLDPRVRLGGSGNE